MQLYKNTTSILILMMFLGCQSEKPNDTVQGEDQLASREVERPLDKDEIGYQKTFYVPIYSDIYINASNPNELLSATLSIRNTSFSDTLFVSRIDYFNTDGELVRKFIDQQIGIPPMATINYVIEREDESGGAGANFIVDMRARSALMTPVVQSIMFGEYSNKAFSFLSEGYVVE